jgi:pimeloyl-ACP methyl ester carboxylesterase
MAYADLGDVQLYYVLDGPVGAPVVMLSNSLGTSADMWAMQVPALTRDVTRYRSARSTCGNPHAYPRDFRSP